MIRNCWICNLESQCLNSDEIFHFDCGRCGKYKITRELEEDKKIIESREIANLSGWISENKDFCINESSFKILKNIKTPSVNERIEKLLFWLDNQTKNLGQTIQVNLFYNRLWSICWVVDQRELQYLIQSLVDRKLIDDKGTLGGAQCNIRILPNGFSYLDEINKKVQSNIGFCAMAFDHDLLDLWSEAISPAITSSGYTPVRIDSEQYNTGIADQIKAKIRQSKFVVADLTLHKNGVYYEAGFAEGLGREVILTCREDGFDKKHFDVQHINIIKWLPNQYQDLKEKLNWRIEGTLGRGTNTKSG